MNNEDLVLKMILDETGFTAGLQGAVKKLGDFDGEVDKTSRRGGQSLGNVWTSFVGNFLASGASKIISSGIGMITGSIDSAINRVDTLNNSNRVFENMGFKVGEVESTMESLTKSITGLPTPMDVAIKGLQLIASSTNDLSKSEEIFSALNNGILGFGGSTEMVDNAIVQLSQAFSNGKTDAQTWNSMINSGMGPALNALAKQMGITTGAFKEGMSDGSISVETFQDALIKLNKEGGGGLKSLEQIAQDSTAGIKTGLSNMKTAITRGVANVITGLDEGLQSAGFGSISEIIADKGAKFESMLNKVADAIPGILKGAKELYDTLEPYAPLFVGLIAGLTTFTAVLKIQQTVEKVSTAFNVWKKTTEGLSIAQKILNATLLANPVALIITAIVALTAGFIYLWKTNEGFRDAVKEIWSNITDFISKAAEKVVEVWNKTMEFFGNMWDGVKEGFDNAGTWMQEAPGKASDFVKEKWEGTKTFFSDLWGGIKEESESTWDKISESASTSAEKASNKVSEMWSGTKQFFSDLWGSVVTTTKDLWQKIIGAITERFNYLYYFIEPAVSAIQVIFRNLAKFLANTWENIKNIAKNAWTIIKNVILAPMLFVTSLISGGWEEAKNNMIAVWNNITESAKQIWGSFKQIFIDYFWAIYSNVMSAWYGIKETLSRISNEIISLLTVSWIKVKFFFINLWIDIKLKAVLMWIDLKFFFINLWIDIKYGVIDAWESIKQFFSDTWASIKQETVDAWTGIKQWLSDTWDAMKQFFFDTLDKIEYTAKNTWSNIKQGVVDGWNGIKNFFTDTIDKMVEGAQKAWENLKKGVTDAIDKVKETFDDLKNIDLFEIGKNIIQGLIDGVGEMIGNVGKKIKSVATTIKDGIKGELEIFSPSRWMKRMIGKNIPLGVVEGIEDEQSTLDNAVRKMADLPTDLPEINVASNRQNESITSRSSDERTTKVKSDGDTYNVTLQAFGDLPEAQMMALAKKFVKYIKEVKDREDAPIGGVFGGI